MGWSEEKANKFLMQWSEKICRINSATDDEWGSRKKKGKFNQTEIWILRSKDSEGLIIRLKKLFSSDESFALGLNDNVCAWRFSYIAV